MFNTFINYKILVLNPMKLILLPGFQKINQVWVDDIKKGFNDIFEKIILVKHFNLQPDKLTDKILDIELNKLIKVINNNPDYVIFAKTTSILVVLKGIAENKIDPKKCVFLQIPIMVARINNINIDDWIYRYDTPTLFIQRRDDSDFFFNNMREYLEKQKVTNFDLFETNTLDLEFKDIMSYKKCMLTYLDNTNDKNISDKINNIDDINIKNENISKNH